MLSYTISKYARACKCAHVRDMKYSEFHQHLKSALNGEANFAPLYVVNGDDEYLKDCVVNAFKQVVDGDYADFNLSVIDNDIEGAIDSAYTFPMFDERKVVILNLDIALTEDGKALITKYLASASDTTVFVIVDDDWTSDTIRSKKISMVNCGRLDNAELVEQINILAKKSPSITINLDASNELIERTQGNMARIASEIAKLKSYSEGVITKQDICLMVSADIDFQIYELANAVSDKNANKALEILDVFFKNGIKGVTIINNLYDKYRKMLHAELNKGMSNDDLAKLLGIKSGAVYFLRKVSSNYSQMRLKRCVDYLHDLQFDVLCGSRNETSAIHEAILQLLTF